MKKINAKKFDAKFDKGEDVIAHLRKSTAKRINAEFKRVNIDFPQWVVAKLDNEATRLGVTRQSVVKMLIAEKFS